MMNWPSLRSRKYVYAVGMPEGHGRPSGDMKTGLHVFEDQRIGAVTGVRAGVKPGQPAGRTSLARTERGDQSDQ